MKVNFNKNSKDEIKKDISQMTKGTFATMTKMRKQKLPEIQASIQEVLEDYDGGSICIIVQHEDENGYPDHHRMLMAGVSRMECQISMGKALRKASEEAMQVLMESSKGDLKAMLDIASALVDDITGGEE